MQQLTIIKLQISNFENLRDMAYRSDEYALIPYIDQELLQLYKKHLEIDSSDEIVKKLRILELITSAT